MADEPTPSAPTTPAAASTAVADPPGTPSNPVATPETDPTPAQRESKTVVGKLTGEIDDLWSQIEQRATADPPAPRERETVQAETAPPAAAAEPAPSDTPPPAAPDTAELERVAYEKAKTDLQARQEAERRAQERLAGEQAYRSQADAYLGAESDYAAVNAALRQAMTGDYSALDALDVMLPTGQKVSQVKAGAKGLTQDEAVGVLNAWETARRFEGVMGDRKVQRIVDLWNSAVLKELDHPDVDKAAVIAHPNPDQQMAALRDGVIAKVTARLTEAHRAEIKAKDAEIKEQAERIKSLVAERPNLASQERARSAASPDRPAQGGAQPRDLPRTPEEIRRMSADDFFKSGTNDRLLASIPGGVSTRRRAG
jgi:hypothetical protein